MQQYLIMMTSIENSNWHDTEAVKLEGRPSKF